MTLPAWIEMKKHPIRSVKTLMTCFGFMCIGLQAGIIGPSLLDLRVLVSSSFSDITYMVTGRSVGYAIGSISAGLIASKINPQLTLMITLLISAGLHFAMPVTRSLMTILIMITVTGVANGMTDTTSNIFVLHIWAKECPPFLQALHFSYGFGSLLAPVIVEPFLVENENDDKSMLSNKSYVDAIGNNMSSFGNETFQAMTELKPDDIQLLAPYCIIAALTIVISFGFGALYMSYRETEDHPTRCQESQAATSHSSLSKVEDQFQKKINLNIRNLIVILTSFFTFCYVGLEANIGTFIPAYAHKGPLGVSKKTGALMASAYWFFFTGFRFVAVFLSSCMGSRNIVFMNLINTFIASIILIISQNNVPLFWFACVYIGIGLSSTWGSLIGFIESQFTITNTIVSCFTVGACIGCSVFPAAVGYFIDIDPAIFVYFNVLFAIVVSIVFVTIYLVSRFFLYDKIPINVINKNIPKDLRIETMKQETRRNFQRMKSESGSVFSSHSIKSAFSTKSTVLAVAVPGLMHSISIESKQTHHIQD